MGLSYVYLLCTEGNGKIVYSELSNSVPHNKELQDPCFNGTSLCYSAFQNHALPLHSLV